MKPKLIEDGTPKAPLDAGGTVRVRDAAGNEFWTDPVNAKEIANSGGQACYLSGPIFELAEHVARQKAAAAADAESQKGKKSTK